LKNNDIYLYDHNIYKNADFNVWMAFPGPESFALSSLGFLWMYKSIDECDDINVEMIFQDTKKTVIHKNALHMLGFSFTFDMDFYNIFSILEQYGFSIKSSDRDDNSPLIFVGGPVVTANPTPYSDVFDFFIIGDGEDLNLKAIQICKENRDKSKKEILQMLLSIFLLEIQNIKEQKSVTKKLPKRTEELFIDFMQLLPRHFAAHHNIDFYAERLNITPDYLSRIVKRASGRTVLDYINRLIMMEASFMLRTSSQSAAQIAEALHFADLASFSHFFIRHKGVSPQKFRTL